MRLHEPGADASFCFSSHRWQTAFLQFGYRSVKKNGVSRGMHSLWLRVSNRGEQHPVGTRFCAAKSSVLYLLRPLTRERGCHRTGQTVSCGSRRTDICRHGRLADIRSSGVGDAAKRRLKTEAVLHRRGSKRYIKPAAATLFPKRSSLIHPSFRRLFSKMHPMLQ